MTDMFKGWKTVVFNVLAAIVPLLELTEFKGLVPAEYLPYYALVVALCNVYLRSITTSAIGKK
jgi:hypothetical protein|tara:strand:+ start:515 stop:703 length:189 start_codon:yes stop_codon:yes gene_type:complete